MAYFAELNENNIVLRVISVADSDTINELGEEDEAVGAEFCASLLNGRWLQTSFNNRIRKQFASIGFTYDKDADVFIVPQPYPSWSLDENYDWQPPVPAPTSEGMWSWNEERQQWTD
jgi:hypothetical protein